MKLPIVLRLPASLAREPRDWRAMIALLASIAGAAVLTWFAWALVTLLTNHADRLISELVRDRTARTEVGAVLVVIVKTLAWGLKLVLAGVIAVLLSLGLAINRRSVKLGKAGFEASGGDDAAPAAAVTTTTTTAVTTPAATEE